MARWTASAKWGEAPALDGQCATLLGLALSEGLGFSEFGKVTGRTCMPSIVVLAPRHCKGTRGAPRLQTSDLAWRSAICIALGNNFDIAFPFSERRYRGLWRDRAPSERPKWLCNFSIHLWLATAATVFGLLFIRLWVMWSLSCRCECLCLAVQPTPPGAHPAEDLNGSVSEA